jgi:mono/diheme cytochrome c family protein
LRILVTLISVALVALAGAGLFVYAGGYNIAATEQHTAPVYWLLEFAMRQSVRSRAGDVQVPPLDGGAQITRGAALYRSHCAQCHGAPGIAPEPFALGLTPVPANLAHTAREWPAAELYWVIKHGIKMAGMPGWAYRVPEEDLWALVAFLRELPLLSPAQYESKMRELPERAGASATSAASTAGPGDAERGKSAIQQYACTTCHRIPGIVGARVPVGPPLEGIATRAFVAGMLPNTTENMVRWLRAPRELNPRTTMPDLSVSERDARDIAAYLATLR